MSALEIGLHLVPLRRWNFGPYPRAWVGQFPNRPSTTFIVDSAIGWRMAANIEIVHRVRDGVRVTYRAAAEGFRTGNATAETGPRKRIVLIGDSFTFGIGVEYAQTYGALVARALPGVDVVNLAMPGFGIDQMWMTVRHRALRLHPTLVVVGFVDDDFDRSLTAYRAPEGFNKPTFVLDQDRLRQATPSDRPGSVVAALEHHSALWTLIRVALRRLAYSVPIGNWWHVNRAILDTLRAECERAGVPVAFVRIPMPGSRPRFAVLREHMRKTHALFLDLADPTTAPGPNIFLPLDGHINERGHRYVADHLLQWIRTSAPFLLDAPPASRSRSAAMTSRRWLALRTRGLREMVRRVDIHPSGFSFHSLWRRGTKRAGLGRMLVHDLRRTAARDLRRAGVSGVRS